MRSFTDKPPYAYFYEETKQVINGNVVQDSAVKSEYDGKILHIDKRDNSDFTHYTIDNKQLNKLLSKNTSKIDLLDRLKKDYSVGKHKTTGKHKATGKHKTTSKHKATGKHKHISKHKATGKHKGKHKTTGKHKHTLKRK
jgi:hypothetical protein